MKTFIAIALALLVGAGVGYGGYAMMGSKTDAPVEMAQSAADLVTNIEPAAEEKVRGSDDPVVATVDGKPIYRTDVLDFIQSLPEQMKQADPKAMFPMAVEQVINGKIVDAKAMSANIESDPEFVKRMADAKTQIMRGVFAEKEINKQYTPEAVKKAYDDIVKSLPKSDEVNARHILVETEAQAKDIIAKLDGGAKFEDLAKKFSKDQSNSGNGGDLGYFGQTDMVKEFSDAAFALKAKEYTKNPVKTQFGFHVIQALDKRPRPAPKLEDVKPQIESQVKRDILNKLVETWRSGATVEAFDYDGKPIVKATEPAATSPAPVEEKKAE